MNIRFATAADYEQWFILWEGYNAFYKRTISSEQTQFSWQRFLNPHEKMFALVAEDQGEIKGFVHYLFHANTATMSDVCYLQDLYTKESVRGQGYGKALIEAVYLKAREAHSPRVYWLTHETNKTAMGLYDKVAEYSGFVVYRKLIK